MYFKCDQTISIELGVKDKVCHEHGASSTKRITSCWYVLSFIGMNLNMLKTGEKNNIDEYKSQQYRHKDP